MSEEAGGSPYREALMSPKSLRRELCDRVDPGQLALNVKEAVALGKEKMRLTVSSQQERDRLAQELTRTGFQLRQDTPRSRPLLMKVHRVGRHIPQERIADMAYDQNPWVREKFPDRAQWKREFEPSFRKGKREYDDVIWVTRVSPAVRKCLLERSILFIGFQPCGTADYIDITQCHKCLGFGHVKAKCLGKVACVKCAGEHLASVCGSQAGRSRCANCVRMGLKDVGHAPDSLSCPVYMRVWKRDMRAVNPL